MGIFMQYYEVKAFNGGKNYFVGYTFAWGKKEAEWEFRGKIYPIINGFWPDRIEVNPIKPPKGLVKLIFRQ